MSLSTSGVWAAGVWGTTVWASGVWYEVGGSTSTSSAPGFIVGVGKLGLKN